MVIPSLLPAKTAEALGHASLCEKYCCGIVTKGVDNKKEKSPSLW